MVVSKDGKRKRKESPIVDSSPEIPKRTKVQAQRKFAQGQGNPSVSYSLPSSAIVPSSSQPSTHVRDSKDPIPELIPHKKPSAEDLVTYICFRGTPGLPPHLEFFNQNKKCNENEHDKQKETDSLNETKPDSKSSKDGNKKGEKSNIKNEKNAKCDNDESKTVNESVDGKIENPERTESIGYAARKRADQTVEGNRKFKNSDRMPRLRERAPKKMETNRRSPRTRSAFKPESHMEIEEEDDVSETSDPKLTPSTNTQVSGRRKAVSPIQKEDKARPTEKLVGPSIVSNLRNKGNANKKNAAKTADAKLADDFAKQKSPVRDHEVKNIPEEPDTSFPVMDSSPKDHAILTTDKQVTPTPEKQLPPSPEKSISKTPEKIEKKALSRKRASAGSKTTSKAGKKSPLERNVNETPEPTEENGASKSPKPKRGRKLAEPVASKKSNAKETNTEEIEKRSSRPMRKTKAAATIYMEWIGLKLNLDDDGSSLDSFPELPNAKETQKIENELKQNRLKEKEENEIQKQTPTSLKEKEVRKQTPTRANKSGRKSTAAKKVLSESKEEVHIEEQKNEVDETAKLEGTKIAKLEGTKIAKLEGSKTAKLEGTKTTINTSKRKEKAYSDSDDEPLVAQKPEIKNIPQPKPSGRGAKKKKLAPKKRGLAVEESKEPLPTPVKSAVADIEIEAKDSVQIQEESKLEKNFSDSDDEPLATKLVTKQPDPEVKTVPEPLQIITEITPVAVPKISPPNDDKISPIQNRLGPPVVPATENSACIKGPISPKYPVRSPMQPAQSAIPPTIPPVMTSLHKPDHLVEVTPIMTLPVISPPGHFTPLERFPSPKVNPSFLTPKFDRHLERKLPVEAATSPLPKNNLSSPPTPKLDFSSIKPSSPSGGVASTKKFGPDPILSANLMPSKEESGKIFGIASVSLAQSSGPDNTKCTLGKCGSIHKPVLGPVVPTEAYLGEPLSSKERRKAKVNMTHEQIQKWLIECSSNPDEIQDDLDDDYEEPLKPKTFAPTPPLMRDEKDCGSVSKVCKDVRKESSWTGKGPSLKATPVVVKEDSREKPTTLLPTDLGKQNITSESPNSPKTQKVVESISKEKASLGTTLKKSESFSKLSHDTTKSPKPSTSSTTSSPKRLKNTKVVPNTTQKKPPVPKRQPVYNTKPATEASKKKPSNNNFSAFSPENETSVYSFDKEDDVPPPVAKPFRRHSRRESNADENTSSEKPGKVDKVQAKETQQNSISLMLSPEENNKSIKVCKENAEAVAIAKTSKAQADTTSAVPDSDSEIQTFYIPLQGTGTTTANSGKADVIQGVAVKLGREGPEGPNQRVIMHATLVTKAQMGSNTTPIPESMNVHEIVKSLLSSNKETPGASKSVPVGTVQPRFKSSADAQLASEPALVRVNSNSSLLSGSTKSKSAPVVAPKKAKDATPIKMFNNTAFPRRDDPTQMVEAPIFRPTDKEFQDPMEFIDRITPIAARFGICKIIPPESFKPECRVSDDMRFTAYNQYVHKMLHRWGPSAKEFSAIKKYLATQSIAMTHPPWIGGMEVDLPRLYHTVQELGGLKEVIEKKKWARVAEEMCIPKLAQDRVTKLDDIYCKYLLPYDTLSPVERQKLFDEVEADWAKREARARRNADRCANLENNSHEEEESSENDDESDEEVDGVSMECIAKGRSMPLNAFFRIARNTMALWFKNTEPTVADIEAEFWRHVAVRDSHVCVHSGSIDSSGWGYGFPTPGPKAKGSPCAKHPWNLKVLTNNAGSVLRSLGPVMGVTVPTLHVGMLFSACCWYRDPHGLSWIEYLHTGASKIWYGIPDEQSSKFRSALTALIPTHCQNKTIWLPCDTVMVPPHMLTDRGVSLCRVEQKPGEFVVIFPRAYTSSIATGYVVSESVYFATSSWLNSAKDDFRDIHESCEPAMFSLEQLLFAVGNDQRAALNILSQIVPMLTEVYHKEAAARQQLKAAGMTQTEKFQPPAAKNKQQKLQQLPEEHECDVCRANLYISMVRTTEGNIYCLQHALRNINNSNIQAKQCTLIFTYDIEDIKTLIKKIEDRLGLLQKKMGGSVGSSKKSK